MKTKLLFEGFKIRCHKDLKYVKGTKPQVIYPFASSFK